MKRFRILFILILFSFAIGKTVYAEQGNFSVASVSESDYTTSIMIVNNVNAFGDSRDLDAYTGKPLKDYNVSGGMLKDGMPLIAKFSWENPDYIILSGEQYVNLICTMWDKTLTIKLYLNGIEIPVKEKVPVLIDERYAVPEEEPAVEEITTPSLTVTSVTLAAATSYDINIVDNIKGTKYAFTSSNPKVATVNAKNGIVKAVKPGNATITCNAILPDGTAKTLTSQVVVGYDENAPVLTEEALDLSVNDTFDITVENRIAKSKYKYASSDWSKIRVNSATGKIRAVGEGDAYVTCTITTPDRQVIVLRCDITITK